MAEPEAQHRSEPGEKLYTLSEISKKTGISMPTLQRYKKLYQNRIPAVGTGRKQRYPERALPVFDQIKNENIGRRGRPRKDASAPRQAGARRGRPGRKPAAAAAPRRGRPPAAAKRTTAPARRGRPPGRKPAAGRGTGNLLTLTEISKTTGISYPTLVRYVRLYPDRLPHEGKGRARRFYPQAVDVFRQIRSESGRGGRKPGPRAGAARAGGRGRAARADEGGVAQRLRAIEKSQEALEQRFRGLVKGLQKLFS